MSIRVWVSAGTVGGYHISWYDKPIGRSSGRMGLSRSGLQEEKSRRDVSSALDPTPFGGGLEAFVLILQVVKISRQTEGLLPGIISSGECTLLEPRPQPYGKDTDLYDNHATCKSPKRLRSGYR